MLTTYYIDGLLRQANAQNARDYLGITGAPGSGDVIGPAGATPNAIARFDGATGLTLKNSTPTIGDGGIISNVTDPSALQDAATKNYVDESIATVAGGTEASQTTFLVSGGQVVWETAYTFRVSAATYYVMGVLYTSMEQIISLDASDPVNDRIDIIAVDDTGIVIKITGTAAAQPSEPDVDPGSQLKLAIVLVGAATTAPPAISTATVYSENAGHPTEWAWTSSGAGWNLASGVDPRDGAVSIEATNISSGAYIEGVSNGAFDINAYDLLVFYLKSKASFPNNRTLVVRLQTGGTVIGSSVTVGNNLWGFDSSNVANYQLIAIPVSSFAVPEGTLIDRIRITRAGPSTIGFFLDDISWQGGGSTQPPSGGLTQEQADALYAPLVHATRHQSGGADAIKLDDLAAPDDNTDLNASAGAHGLLPKLSGTATEYLDGSGSWSTPPSGGTTPTGTGFRHVTAGVEDAASKLVENADVHAAAAIVESKLALNFPTHSNANDPTSDEKAALAGTDGTPSAANPYVTDSDSRLSTTHKRGCMLALCIAYTPLATGADRGEVTVPYDPDDGTTGLTWNIRRITLRVSQAGGAPSVRIEKSTAGTAFSAATVGDVTLGSGDYEGSNTTALGTVASGNKLRMNVLTLATAEFWTVTIELGEN